VLRLFLFPLLSTWVRIWAIWGVGSASLVTALESCTSPVAPSGWECPRKKATDTQLQDQMISWPLVQKEEPQSVAAVGFNWEGWLFNLIFAHSNYLITVRISNWSGLHKSGLFLGQFLEWMSSAYHFIHTWTGIRLQFLIFWKEKVNLLLIVGRHNFISFCLTASIMSCQWVNPVMLQVGL